MPTDLTAAIRRASRRARTRTRLRPIVLRIWSSGFCYGFIGGALFVTVLWLLALLTGGRS